jgi:hypothetical protein
MVASGVWASAGVFLSHTTPGSGNAVSKRSPRSDHVVSSKAHCFIGTLFFCVFCFLGTTAVISWAALEIFMVWINGVSYASFLVVCSSFLTAVSSPNEAGESLGFYFFPFGGGSAVVLLFSVTLTE